MLRPYQQQAVDGARAAVVAGRDPVVVIPTGGGKTVVGCAIVQGAVSRGRPVLWLAHRMELVDQAHQRLERHGIAAGIIMAGRDEDRAQLVQVASIQTLARRALPPARLIVLDEAHHVRAESYERLLQHYPEASVIGLTATPVRLDGRGLGETFDEIVAPVSCADLIEQGFLVEPRYFAPSQPDFTGVRRLGGDYQQDEAAEVMRGLTGNVVQHYQRLGNGGRAVVFACNVAHSQALVAAFNAAGIVAEHLDGDTPKAERQALLARLASGQTRVVSNCSVLTEGWDLPALEVCILARPTTSWALHLQMIGRVMRPAGDKQAVVLDHAGNLVRHGFPTDPVEYDLSDSRRAKPADDLPKARVCKGCLATMPAAATTCGVCQQPFPVTAKPPLSESGGELREVKAGRDEKARYYEDLMFMARKAGYFRGWVSHQYRARFGVWPRGPWRRGIDLALVAGDPKVGLGPCPHVKRTEGVCNFCGDGDPNQPWEIT